MKYDIKEYEFKFDTPIAREQEKAVVQKIMDLLNNKKYDDLEKFFELNADYNTFLKQQHMDVVVKHFGNTFTDEDYKIIIENLRELTKQKSSFNTEDIKTTQIGDQSVSTYENPELDKTHYLINNNQNKTIEEELKDKQTTSAEFQTADEDVNTGRMMQEMEEKEKESLQLHYLNEINTDLLNEEERGIFNAAANYQLTTNESIQVDVSRGVIVNKDGEIYHISKEDGVFEIRNGDGEKEDTIKAPQKQFVLTNTQNQ